MAENNSIGEISFGVNADTGELLASTKVVDSATNKMANSFQELTKKIAGTESGSSKLAAQFGGAGKAAAALENDIKRLGGQVQSNGNVVDQFGVRNAKLTATLAQLRGATFQTTNSFRMMRGGMQQMGYQVQDVAVQLQMGTNPLMVLAQQGSQVASLFGTGGALFGAVLAISAAIGMSLMPSLFDSKDAMDKLKESVENLGDAIEIKDGVARLTEEIRELAKESRGAAMAQLAQEIVDSQKVIANSADVIRDEFFNQSEIYSIAKVWGQFNKQLEAGGNSAERAWAEFNGELVVANSYIINLQRYISNLSNDLGVSEDSVKQFLSALNAVNQDGSTESILNLQEVFSQLNAETNYGNKTLMEWQNSLSQAFSEARNAGDIMRIAKGFMENFDDALNDSLETTRKAKKSYQDLVNGLGEQAATAGMTSRELHIFNVTQQATIAKQEQMIPALVKAVNVFHDIIDASDKATAAEKARKQEVERGTKSLDDQIAQLAFKTETLGMDERQLAKHTAMQLINSSSLDVNTEAVMANLDALYDALEAKQRNIDIDKDLDNQTKNAVKTYRGYQKSLKDQQTALMTTKDQREAFIENIKEEGVLAGRNAGQINKLVEGYRALWAAQDEQTVEKRIEGLEKEIELQVLKNALTNEQFELEAALMALGDDATPDQVEHMTALIEKMQEARFASELLGEDIRTALQDVGLNALDNLSSGLANAIMQGDSLSETLKNVGRTMVGEMLTAAIRFFVGQAAASLMGISTTTGAAVAQAGIIASAMAPAATLANVATSGGAALAAAATMPIASAATASVMSLGGALGGGRLYGGRTEAGKMHPILEDGKPEMLTVGNKNYLMTPSAGMVTSNKDMASGGGSMQSNNVNLSLNLSPNTPQEFRRQLFENQELVYSIVQRALNDRGRRF